MTLSPSLFESLARARADLRIGLPVVLTATAGSAVVIAAETLMAERLACLRQLGDPILAITARRADTLKARVYDGDLARIPLCGNVEVSWIMGVANPADDLTMPLKGPFSTQRGGDTTLARTGIRLARAARLLPAVVMVNVSAKDFSALRQLTRIDASLAISVLDTPTQLQRVISAHIPLEVSETARLHVFRPREGSEEHNAIEIGRPTRGTPMLVRLHSACFTGDLLGSLKCDCGPQLRTALKRMGDDGAGILLYLNQEGRGIGLANKMRAYSLQDQGFDTVEANHRLGFEDDERDFRIGAEMLAQMGVSRIRLLTNNPAKVEMMREHGIAVTERVPLLVGLNPLNARYLDTKAKKSGHIL